MKRIVFTLLSAAALMACEPSTEGSKKQMGTSASTGDFQLMLDARGFFKSIPAVAENPYNACTPAKVNLGKMLYFDSRLSMTGNNSCNSCHNLSTFGVDNEKTSTGDNGGKGDRNSPTSFNAAFHTMQFWDGRAKDVEEQAGMPILNPAEMAIPSKEFLVNRLKGIPEYRQLFSLTYGSDAALTYDNIQNAIGAFERTLATPSRFDQYLSGNYDAISAEEKGGMKLFMSVGCTNCHNGAAIGGGMLQKFGLLNDYHALTGSTMADLGRMKVTGNPLDKDYFKVPSLRNIEKTYPYFHDGSVADLGQAVQIMGKAQLNKDLSKEEVNLIVTFLKCLTSDVPASVKVKPTILAENNTVVQ